VMNGKAGHHQVELAKLGKRLTEVVLQNLDGAVLSETRSQTIYHHIRKIHSD